MVSADLHSNLRIPGLSLLFSLSCQQKLIEHILYTTCCSEYSRQSKRQNSCGTNMLDIFNLMRYKTADGQLP